MEPIYVYRHRRLDDHQVFYVGIGIKKRPFSKEGRNKIWKDIVKKHGYYVQIIQQVDSWKLACELEMFLISLYGRIDNGTGILANMTDGGDGVLGKKMTTDTIEKLRIISKNRVGTKSVKSKLTEEQVLWIRNNYLYNSKEFGLNAISKKLNISKKQIFNIIHRKQWSHI